MTPAETAASLYAKAEAKFCERATFYDLTGQQALAQGSRWYADRCHRAVLAEITDPKPQPIVRRVR